MFVSVTAASAISLALFHRELFANKSQHLHLLSRFVLSLSTSLSLSLSFSCSPKRVRVQCVNSFCISCSELVNILFVYFSKFSTPYLTQPRPFPLHAHAEIRISFLFSGTNLMTAGICCVHSINRIKYTYIYAYI